MRRIALIVSYEGSNFFGWQLQKKERTVQGDLEQALFKLTGELSRVEGSGRTDAGVHAHGQVASFLTQNDTIPAERFYMALNRLLKHDVRVLASFSIALNFDARRAATRRVYRYRMVRHNIVLPTWRAFVAPAYQELQLIKLNQLASLFVGEHDFTAFCSTKDVNPHKRRIVYKSYWVMEGPVYCYHIEGNAFLMNMVRCLVGTMLMLQDNPNAGQQIREALETGNRALAGSTFAAVGLTLHQVCYPEPWAAYGLPSDD